MRKSLLFAASLLMLVACSETGCTDQEDSTNITPIEDDMAEFVGLELVDLKEEGQMPIKVWLPKEDKTTGPRKIKYNGDFARCEIEAGKGFDINISEALEGEDVIGMFKTDPQLDIYTKKEFIIEEDSAILFRGSNEAIDKDIYMFRAIVTAGNSTYVVENKQFGTFTESQCKKVLKTVKDAREL